jgi:hypothetical protein
MSFATLLYRLPWSSGTTGRGARPARSHRSAYRPRLEVLEDRAVPSNVPPAGITGWWTGDGSADDLIGGRNGSLVGGATTGPGLVDQAFVLNGSGAFVNVPDNPALNVGTGNFTVGLWVKFNTTAGEQVLAEKYIETFGSSATGWTLTKLSTNVLRLALTDGVDVPIDVDSSTLTLPLNTWTYFAARRSGNTITTFVNGQAVASRTCAYNLNATSSLKFGHRGNPSDTPGSTDTRQFYLNGGIDEVQLYVGTALTNTQIQGIYNDGAAGENKPMAVSRATPAADSTVVGAAPTDFAVHFSEGYAAASLQAGDFTVNGIAADSVTLTGANDATFHYNATPVTVQGLETMHVDAGSVTAADTTLPASYQPLEAWTKTFRYDAVQMQVSATSPAAGGFIALPNPTLQVSFNEAYDPGAVGIGNLTLSQGTVTGFTLSADHTSVTYALSGMSEGSVNVSIPAGALTDAYGFPMVAYAATYGVDFGTMPFAAPLAALNPAEAMVSQGGHHRPGQRGRRHRHLHARRRSRPNDHRLGHARVCRSAAERPAARPVQRGVSDDALGGLPRYRAVRRTAVMPWDFCKVAQRWRCATALLTLLQGKSRNERGAAGAPALLCHFRFSYHYHIFLLRICPRAQFLY